MEVVKIEETNQAVVSKEVRLGKACSRVCIYYPDAICKLPKLQFKICRTCPRAAQYIRRNVVRSIFEYIKSVAISFLNMININGGGIRT